MSDYTSVQIPKVLTDKVKQKMAKQGYRTVSEFVIDAVNRIRIYFGELDPADESFLGLTIFDVLKEKNKEISDLREVIDTTREICGMAKIDWDKKPLQSTKKEPDADE